MRKVNVIVHIAESAHWYDAAVYLEDGQRLTDMMNDTRTFIPVWRESQNKDVVINKNIIEVMFEK